MSLIGTVDFFRKFTLKKKFCADTPTAVRAAVFFICYHPQKALLSPSGSIPA